MNQHPNQLALLSSIVHHIGTGIFVINIQNKLLLWNSYMENHSKIKANDILGQNLFKIFPELPQKWLEQKFHSVFASKSPSFSSSEHRPHLFNFLRHHPITDITKHIQQNCTFLPLKGDSNEIEFICISIFDANNTNIYLNTPENPEHISAETGKANQQTHNKSNTKNIHHITIGNK